MQELISKRNKFSYPQTIKISDFAKLDEDKKKSIVKQKIDQVIEALKKADIDSLAKVRAEDITEKNVRTLNRLIRTIKSGDTETNFVVELYETIVELRGTTKKIHWEIYNALEGQVKIPSIRRILSEYRNGKLR